MAGKPQEQAGPTAGLPTAELEVGVLALQGAFREHLRALRALGVTAREVRLPQDLSGLRGLIIPGGESTTIGNLMSSYALWEPVKAFHAGGGALWGSCAGAVLLANRVSGNSPALGAQPSLNLLDVTAQRNAFGRQVDSFSVNLEVAGLGAPFPAIFIRAPVLEQPGEGVEVLAHYGGKAVLVRQGRVLASAFHPELTDDSRLHQLFLDMLEAS